ncbi:LPXTG cell wall anchor domain-containing protein [Lactobacillus pasteurii]|uniref:LPXTG cell wall anchor domain-containing protein n=1 Tax=Lactobacillus pasteurii TaxID=872327 RepID=UPI0022A9A289|nr:LPXTG cell wall anchor domain-containing protein [Lactobacillus pasteurii]
MDAVVDIYYRADVPVLPATPVDPKDPSTPTTPVTPTDPSTPPINVKNNISNELASSSKVEDEVEDTTDSQEKLPQTGNKSSVIYSIFGLILTSLL